MTLRSLRSLYEHDLRELQDGELQLTQILPRMAEAASDEDLKKHLNAHAQQSRKHRERLESILDGFESSGNDVTCEGIRGITREAERFMQQDDVDETVRDAALLSIAQKLEHYEMAGYGALRTYADLLGENEAREALQKTLDEEGGADDRLTDLAERSINRAAKA